MLAKTFGGLSREYYFRQFIFGLIFPAFFIFMATHGTRPMTATMIFVLVVNTLLYPYSRFVYEGIVGFIMGENLFLVNAFFMLVVKALTMALCWCFAIFIAPVGLAYLYYRNSKLT
ncbi:hypothetical protein [Paraburkholderia aspalathi]|uniref:hypothetical protein n=1 Tax=Paraburkholderia aspalathi TaxID=1324617 RepID=UPI0027DC72BA|nr:hypothetical protein [Paraburkholderia aspalathi]